MSKKSKYEHNAFTNLVKAIDAKWSHTYIDVEWDEEPEIDELLAEIREMEAESIFNKIEG